MPGPLWMRRTETVSVPAMWGFAGHPPWHDLWRALSERVRADGITQIRGGEDAKAYYNAADMCWQVRFVFEVCP